MQPQDGRPAGGAQRRQERCNSGLIWKELPTSVIVAAGVRTRKQAAESGSWDADESSELA
jgi:hypothetical protein